MQLRGAVAVVTGASAGIGEVTAAALAREGAKVVLAARRLDRLEQVADAIENRGGIALAVRCDVADRDQVETLPTVVKEAFGRCDVLVNNAGIPGGGPFSDLDMDAIERIVRVNLLGVMLCTKAFLPMMLKQHRGHIVNIASLAGRFAAPGASVYSASKHGVVAFSESLSYELDGTGLLVTSVNPAFAATEGFPQTRLPPRIVMKAGRVAGAIVHVLKRDIAPEYSVPRWISPFQAFRILTPPLYRWGMRTVVKRARATRG